MQNLNTISTILMFALLVIIKQTSNNVSMFYYFVQTEREFSLQQSSTVNKAYSTLQKPLSRGLYLLELHGQSVEESDTHIDPQFLMEIMEINEELADADTLEAIEDIGATNQKVLDELTNHLSEAFKSEDISKAKELLGRLKYYANIDEKVKDLQRLYAERI